MAGLWPDDSIFDGFTIIKEIYKTVESHDIEAAVLIPKNIKPGSHPVIFNIHGGFLVYGHSLFAPFFPPWALKLALENSAIVVSTDYRLIPSANGVADVLEDLEDSWQWIRTHLSSVLERHAPGRFADLSRLLLTGGSAGGYAVLQIALSHPTEISALALAYPFIDPMDDAFVKGPEPGAPTMLRLPEKDIPSKDDVISWAEETRKTTASKAEHERGPFAVGAAQHGIFNSLVFDNSQLNRPEFQPLERIKAGAKLPNKIWLLHGDDDTVVYIRASHKFVNLVHEKLPDTTIRFDIAPREDHAFDLVKSTWELHAIGALEFVRKSWLEV